MTLTRSSSRVAVSVTVALLLVLGVIGGVVPAFAGHGVGTANVNVHEVLAGDQDESFTVTVTHPAGPGAPFPPDPLNPPTAPAPLNWVLIFVPPGFTVDSATGPNEGGAPAWDAAILTSGGTNRVIFTLKSGKSGIAAGSSGAFAITADVPRPVGERTTSNWAVGSSSDGGATQQVPTGDLSTRVRILKVDDVEITGPAGAVDGSVSGLQGTFKDPDGNGTNDELPVTARCLISNHASVAHTITPSLDGGSNVTIEEAAPAASVPAGGTGTFSFRLSFADVPNTSNNALICNGTSTRTDGGSGSGTTNVTGFNAQTPLTIQPRAVFTYVPSTNPVSFSPSALGPNSTPTFKVLLKKGGSANGNAGGSPAVTLNSTQTNLRFNKNGSTLIGPISLSAGGSVGAGTVVNHPTEYAAGNIGPQPNGRQTGELRIRGIDANDSIVAHLPLQSFVEQLLIDAGIPSLELNIAPPLPPTGWPHSQVPRAARNTQSVSFGGQVQDADPDTGTEGGCGTCTVIPGSAVLKQFDDANASSGADIPVTLAISGTGAVSGSFTLGSGAVPIGATTSSLVLQARVVDVAGNPSALTTSTGCLWCPAGSESSLSGRAPVDNIAPVLVSAKSMRAADGAQNQILVTLNECVNGVSTTNNWRLAGTSSPTQRVTAVSAPTCSVSSAHPYSSTATITLTLSENLPDDSTAETPLPSVEYVGNGVLPVGGAGTRYHDRTSANVVDKVLALADGIAPLAPVIQSIKLPSRTTAIGTQDGAFWSNINDPKFVVADQANQGGRSIKAGNMVRIFQETNNVDGLQPGSDTKLSTDTELTTSAISCAADGICSTEVTADFTVPGASSADTSQSEAVHTIYAVVLDKAVPKNASVEDDAAVELDRIKPNIDLVDTLLNPTDVTVSFTDSLAFGQNRAGDWLLVDPDQNGIVLTSVQNGSSADSRRLVVGQPSTYSGQGTLMSLGYEYFGPAGGRYEDRATNALDNFVRCLTPGPCQAYG